MTTSKCPIRYVSYTNRDPIWIRPELVAEMKIQQLDKRRDYESTDFS